MQIYTVSSAKRAGNPYRKYGWVTIKEGAPFDQRFTGWYKNKQRANLVAEHLNRKN